MAKKIKDKSTLDSLIASAGDKLVAIEFYATWCGPCKAIEPIVNEIAESHSDNLLIFKIDVDESDDLVVEYGIKTMPTFIFKRKGKRLDVLSGGNEKKLREFIKKYIK